MTYDNIKSHKKPGFHPLFRRYIFWKKHRERGSNWTPPPPSHFKAKHSGNWKVIPMKLIVINIRKYKGKAISVFFRTYLDVSTHLHPLYASVHFMLDLPPPPSPLCPHVLSEWPLIEVDYQTGDPHLKFYQQKVPQLLILTPSVSTIFTDFERLMNTYRFDIP